MTSQSDGFSFSPVSEADVILAVSLFKTQVKGEDDIPQGIVAKALPVITPFVTRLFNTPLANRVFPPAWERANHRAEEITSTIINIRLSANSLLCFVLEKLAYDQVVDFLAKEKIMDPF